MEIITVSRNDKKLMRHKSVSKRITTTFKQEVPEREREVRNIATLEPVDNPSTESVEAKLLFKEIIMKQVYFKMTTNAMAKASAARSERVAATGRGVQVEEKVGTEGAKSEMRKDINDLGTAFSVTIAGEENVFPVRGRDLLKELVGDTVVSVFEISRDSDFHSTTSSYKINYILRAGVFNESY